MTSREEISLQLTLATLNHISIAREDIGTQAYEIYNSIYENIKTSDTEPVQTF